MLIERVEERWIRTFVEVLERCDLKPAESVAVLAETQSRPILSELCLLAAARIGAQAFQITVPTPALTTPIPIRSTGASTALTGQEAVVRALAGASLILDCTVEGLLHAPELARILAGADGRKPRLLMISNEHPEILERTRPVDGLEASVRAAMKLLRAASRMTVRSPHGTALEIGLEGARVGGVWGTCSRPGQVSHWPGGLVLAFPCAGAVSGRLVLAPGDVNLTFKRYLESPVTLTVEADYVTDVAGASLDADLMRRYWASFGEREAYAVSHVGWGLNPIARWDALAFYDKRDCNGTELRAFAGNFLYSTGANEVAGRHTLGHFDLPMAGCTVALDDHVVVDAGRLVGDVAP